MSSKPVKTFRSNDGDRSVGISVWERRGEHGGAAPVDPRPLMRAIMRDPDGRDAIERLGAAQIRFGMDDPRTRTVFERERETLTRAIDGFSDAGPRAG